MIRTHVIAGVCGLLVLAVMVELLRRRQLREKYAILWLGVSIVVIALAAFPGLLDWSAHRLGIYSPPNLLLFARRAGAAAGRRCTCRGRRAGWRRRRARWPRRSACCACRSTRSTPDGPSRSRGESESVHLSSRRCLLLSRH